MIDDLKRYESYAPSDQPWIGDVPSHWDIKPNRALFSEVKDRDSAHEEMLSVTISRGVIRQKAFLSGSSKKDGSRKDRSAYKLIQPGDIAYNKMRAWQGAVGVSAFRGIVSPAYVVMRPRYEYSARYFHELFRTPAFAKEAERWSYGITSDMWSLRPEHFKMIWSPMPPLDEQAAIIRVLEHANHRIESYVREKRKLIALLNEQKQATILRTITRGLDPNAPMKDSGLPWVGSLPAHWDTPLMGRCVRRIEQGWSPVAAEGDIQADQWAVLTLSSVRRGEFKASAIKPISRSADVPTALAVREGDFLLTRSNARDRVGDVCIATGVRPKTILCDLIYRLVLQTHLVEPKFLAYQLLSPFGRGQIERDARGSSGTMPKIAQGHITAWRVFLPPTLEEQRAIVNSIQQDTAPIHAVLAKAEREIALMNEYRTRLVADVVTGQFDVREAARNLPPVQFETIGTEDEGTPLEDEVSEEEAVA